jgi:rubrerythrin
VTDTHHREDSMPTTQENLATAFAGESQANRKYLAFARQAEKEGMAQIAKLFRAAADAETIHALAHFENMGGVGTTLENLQAAIAGETHEFREMYPPMLEQAKAEGHRSKTALGFALAAEQVHARLYQLALEALRAGKDLSRMEIYLCPICGDIELGAPPEKCPICNAPAAKFVKVS